MNGLLLALGLGFVFAFGGVLAILDPQLGLLRDIDAVESDQPGEMERFFSYVGGLLLLAIGLFFLFISVAPYL